MSVGRLILCSLPIGNKNDISLNVLDALKNGVHIYAEDTRSIKKVISDYALSLDGKIISSFHDQSSENDLNNIFSKINSGNDVYYFSEAGSPAISDPGFPLIRMANNLAIEVITYPGPCAVISAIELSGLPSIPFTFGGFLPRETSKILEILESNSMNQGTYIYFESPRRVRNLINILETKLLSDSFPTEICLVREITKKNQQVLLLNKDNFLEKKDLIVDLGEFVVLFHFGKENNNSINLKEVKEICLELMEKGMNQKSVSKLISKITHESPKSIYQKLISK